MTFRRRAGGVRDEDSNCERLDDKIIEANANGNPYKFDHHGGGSGSPRKRMISVEGGGGGGGLVLKNIRTPTTTTSPRQQKQHHHLPYHHHHLNVTTTSPSPSSPSLSSPLFSRSKLNLKCSKSSTIVCVISNYMLIIGVLSFTIVNLISVHNFTRLAASSSYILTTATTKMQQETSTNYYRNDISLFINKYDDDDDDSNNNIMVSSVGQPGRRRRSRRRLFQTYDTATPSSSSTTSSHHHHHDDHDKHKPSYGDIEYSSLLSLLPKVAFTTTKDNNNNNNNNYIIESGVNQHYWKRRIYPLDYERYELHRESIIEKMNKHDRELSFDIKYGPTDDIQDLDLECTRNNWKSLKFPNCNEIHQLVLERPPPSPTTTTTITTKQQEDDGIGFANNNASNNNNNSPYEDNLVDEALSSLLQTVDLKYLGHGHFRNAWLVSNPTTTTTHNNNNNDANNNKDDEDEFVIKRLRLNDNFQIDYYDMYKIQLEAIIMERLSASPRIINIYGHCSTTIFAEAMESEIWLDMVPGTGHIKQKELDQLQTIDVHPMNNFTAFEKLNMSIEMAEALADMHGYVGGTFLHGDTHPEQWLKGKDGRLVLNDFNNAEILDYDIQNQKYCNVYRDYGGFYRAPEEYGNYITESIDTYSLGNNIYCLLTGLWPFYPWDDYSYIRNKILKNKERAYIDPRYRTRSFIESNLVKVIEKTWEFDGQGRVSIFEVVKFLKQIKREYYLREYRKQHPDTSQKDYTQQQHDQEGQGQKSPHIKKNHNFKIVG